MEDYGDDTCLDVNDPNYDSDNLVIVLPFVPFMHALLSSFSILMSSLFANF